MGRFYTNAIMYGLKGRTLDGQPYREEDDVEEKKNAERLTAEIAFLLTIAARQPDPSDKHDGLNTSCWGDEKTLRAIMHMSHGKFYNCAKRLKESGIITFVKSEGEHTNVYRINLCYLRKFYPDVDVWRDDILKISSKDNLSEGVLRALQVIPSVHTVDEKVHAVDKKVHAVDTNIKKHKDNTHATDVDAVFLESIVLEIANVLRVDPMAINRKPLAKAIAGKFPDSVRRTINQPPDWVLKDSTTNKIGALIGVLSKLPAEKDDPAFQAKKPQTVEDYLRQISAPCVKELTNDACRAVGCDTVDSAKKISLFIQNRLSRVKPPLTEGDMCQRFANAIEAFRRKEGEAEPDAVERFFSSVPAD